MKRPLVIAILAKSAEHILPLYLKSIESQSVIDESTIFYIRTNDNKDNTSEVLKGWIEKMKERHEIYFDDSSVDSSLKDIHNHDWTNHQRFKILGEIRQKSIEFAISKGADYFIADVDNILMPHAIMMLRATNLPVVAPLLKVVKGDSPYSNYHSDIDENGYLKENDNYFRIFNGEIKGIVEQPVIHCTYFIKNEYLPFVSYDDDSWRFEYVIFSDVLRKKGIPQYLDNRLYYGNLFFSIDKESFDDECDSENGKKLLSIYKLN